MLTFSQGLLLSVLPASEEAVRTQEAGRGHRTADQRDVPCNMMQPCSRTKARGKEGWGRGNIQSYGIGLPKFTGDGALLS